MSDPHSVGGWHLIMYIHFWERDNFIIICNDSSERKKKQYQGHNSYRQLTCEKVILQLMLSIRGSLPTITDGCDEIKKTLCLTTLFFAPGWEGPPRCFSPPDITSSSSITYQIPTGALWWGGFYFSLWKAVSFHDMETNRSHGTKLAEPCHWCIYVCTKVKIPWQWKFVWLAWKKIPSTSWNEKIKDYPPQRWQFISITPYNNETSLRVPIPRVASHCIALMKIK